MRAPLPPRFRPALALLLIALLAAWARAGTPVAGFSDELYVGGLSSPTAIAFMPDGKLLIAEKGGFGGAANAALKLFNGTTTTSLGTIPVCTTSEMGLLGIALDPNFGTNGFVYLYRTKAGAGGCGTATGRFNQVVRVTMSGGSIGSLTELLSGIQTDEGNHDGGVLRIGPDQKLYVGAGDSGKGDNVGGPGSATNQYAPDLTALNGKILRIELNGAVPADNPFVGMGSDRGEIWAYGFRNPFRMSFDGATGKLWVGDVGDLTVEEVDIIQSGGNYSWPRCEGDLQGPPNAPTPCVVGTDVAPIFTYPHSGGSSLGRCLIGGAFAGAAFGVGSGDYVFGDCGSATIYEAVPNGMRDGLTGTPMAVSTNAGTPADFVTGPDGAIYYVDVTGGEVRRLASVVSGVDALLSGKLLVLKANPTNAAKKSALVMSKDPLIDLGGGAGSGDDPTINGGSLRIVRPAAGGFDDTYPMPVSMPPAGWAYIGKAADGKGYKYKDPKQVNGPVKTATIINGKLLKAIAKGNLGHDLAANPAPVSAVLTTGGKRYCLTFTDTKKFVAGKLFSSTDASAPAACPP